MVSKIMMENGTRQAFLCDRPPDKLIDEMFKKRLAFYDAAAELEPEQILDQIPITFPIVNVLDRDLFPGIGIFDVEKAEKEARPYFSQVSWILLCQKIVLKGMNNLQSIWDVCTELTTGQTDCGTRYFPSASGPAMVTENPAEDGAWMAAPST